ncbi:substrate-binding domain-containing protein [Microbacterium sp. NPDC087665]|uniref:substrate-binding domain-containing protein n=1 Tax=Microbacterium sp. NPDC087665 TaxID=3364194 RepID=UPI003826C170
MRKVKSGSAGAVLMAVLMLAGCAPDGDADGADDKTGFAEDATVGVLLPEEEDGDIGQARDTGELFAEALEGAGFTADVQFQNPSPKADERGQIEDMIDSGAKVLIIADVHIGRSVDVLNDARDDGVIIIAYERLNPWGTIADYGVAVDHFEVGESQAKALLEGLAEKYPEQSTYTVELFSGVPSDDDDTTMFEGAMSILQPKIDDGTLVVVSGEVSRKETDTESWRENSITRMDALLQGPYQSVSLDGVLVPNDLHAQAVIESVSAHGREVPVVVGQGSAPDAVSSIVSGVQYATTYTDERDLVDMAITMVEQLQGGEKVTVVPSRPETEQFIDFPTNLLAPVLATHENAAEVYADDPDLAPLTQP